MCNCACALRSYLSKHRMRGMICRLVCACTVRYVVVADDHSLCKPYGAHVGLTLLRITTVPIYDYVNGRSMLCETWINTIFLISLLLYGPLPLAIRAYSWGNTTALRNCPGSISLSSRKRVNVISWHRKRIHSFVGAIPDLRDIYGRYPIHP